MKIKILVLLSSLSLITTISHADICGIVHTNQGRTAAQLIDAKIAQNPKKTATIIEMGQAYEVVDALVSNKNGTDWGDGKYFDFIVKLPDGTRRNIDIGYTYLVINDGKTAVSLQHLTGCSNFDGGPAVIDLSNTGHVRPTQRPTE